MEGVDGVVLAVVGAIAIVALTILYRTISSAQSVVPVPAEAETAGDIKHDGKRKKAKGGMTRLRNRQRGVNDGGDAPPEANIDLQFSEEEEDEDDQKPKKMGAKKLAKEEAKKQRAAAREAMLAEREDAKRREEARRAEADAAKAAEAEAERLREEEEKKAAEEQKRKEEEEYQAMKAMFSVEEAGSVQDEIATESQSLLSELITYVKETKIVQLEQLASKFKLKTRDVIMRLEALEKMGQISGVMTDNGKYIYISDDEFQAVVKFMRQRGRVSISELSENSHKLITLKGTA